MRNAMLERKTRETEIRASLEVDGSGRASVDTGCGFLDHMLRAFAANAMFNLDVVCRGDVEVDYHHTTEDVGIVLGTVFNQAMTAGGVTRYGSAFIPMDEALVMAAVDLSGRPCLEFSLDIPSQKVGDFDTELVEEFFNGFVRKSGVTLHIRQLSGRNSHHIIEAAFKAFGRALRAAVTVDPALGGAVPSTKGVL